MALFQHRGIHCPLLVLWFLASPVRGEALPLTEQQSLGLGLNRSEVLASQSSRVEQARGELTRRETWTNPELELSRENLGDETEISVWLRQELDISGRRALRRDAARAGLRAVQAQTANARNQRSAEIRRQFFQTLYQQRRQELLERWVEKYSEVEAAMLKREAAGDVSGYDRRRISRERISLLSRQRESRATYRAHRQQLAGLLGLADAEAFGPLQGVLIPTEPPPLDEILQALQGQPKLLQLQHRIRAKRLVSDALGRGYIPDLTLGLGHKRHQVLGESDSGMMLSASLSLPLFDRRQGERQQVLGELEELESEVRLTRSRLQGQTRSLWQLVRELADNARQFREQSLAASYELVRIAQTAYRNNELGVLELIDAYRSALDADLEALQLALEARDKRIELDRLSGEVLP
jgi:cobalt-zinc-cadmium efflux system outer membrane protein